MSKKVNPLTGTTAPRSSYYVDPVELSCAIVESQQLSCCTDQLADMIVEISKRVINLPKFNNWTREEKDNALSFHYYRMMKRGIYVVDPSMNPFSYMTRSCILNCIRYSQIVQNKEARRKEYVIAAIKSYEDQFGQLTPLLRQQLEQLEGDDSYED